MSSHVVARPYADAISMLALKNKQQESWLDLLNGLIEVVRKPEIMAMVQHPSVSNESIFNVIKTALAIKDNQQERLIQMLVENKRLSAVCAIKDILHKIFLSRAGKVQATVTSASALSPALEKKVKTFVMQHFNASGVELISHVDPALVASIMLEVDGKQLDWSISHQLEKFKEQF